MNVFPVGCLIDRLSFDQAFSLLFDDGSTLRIETPFSVRSSQDVDGLVDLVDPAHVAGASERLLGLLHQRVLRMDLDDDETRLTIDLADGWQLAVSADSSFEAWSLASASGELIVAMPGGGMARFGGVSGAS